MKTAADWIKWCKSLIGNTVYWYGTFYQKCTDDLYKRKCVQYPDHYTSARQTAYKRDIENGKMCCDCVGMLKGFIWMNDDGKVVYASNGCPDKSAEGMEKWAISQGAEHGDISTLPDEVGIVLVKDGHTGGYAGNGFAVEAKGFTDDIVITSVKPRGWKRWYKHPCLKYDEAKQIVSCPYSEPVKNVRRGSTGEGVKWVQWMIAACGYQRENVEGVDGIFGRGTEADVKRFQNDHALEVDGIVGILTRTELNKKV